jgi:hypothetical protein
VFVALGRVVNRRFWFYFMYGEVAWNSSGFQHSTRIRGISS